MAFVFRASRDRGPKSPTASHLGPGVFVPPSSFGAVRPNYAPFASTSARQDRASKVRGALPGPGSYYRAPEPQRQEVSNNAFKSTLARFAESKRAAEAPG